jgi:hypothetical protein
MRIKSDLVIQGFRTILNKEKKGIVAIVVNPGGELIQQRVGKFMLNVWLFLKKMLITTICRVVNIENFELN